MRVLRITPQVLPGAREPTVPEGMLAPALEEKELENRLENTKINGLLSCQENIGSIVCHFCLDTSYI